MLKVETDKAQNTLRLTFSQQVGQREFRQYRAELEAAVEKLQPGFLVLTDLSRLEEMEYSCVLEIQAMMDLFRKKGVAKIVRVIPDPKKDIGFTVMSYFHYHDHPVAIVTCETLAEATKRLSS